MYQNRTYEGRKVYFRCKKVKKRNKKQCSAEIYLLYHADKDDITAFKTASEHDECTKIFEIRGLSEDMKKQVRQMYDDGITKPKQIIRALQARKIQPPKKKQLTNYLSQYKKQKYGESSISLGQLEQWCEDHSTIPANQDEAFVVNYYIGYQDENDEDDDEDDDVYFQIFCFIKTPTEHRFASKAYQCRCNIQTCVARFSNIDYWHHRHE